MRLSPWFTCLVAGVAVSMSVAACGGKTPAIEGNASGDTSQKNGTSGNGSTNGTGNGSANGSGTGNGSANGSGTGNGSSNGSGSGSANGSGTGAGSSNGSGSGSANGSGTGSGGGGMDAGMDSGGGGGGNADSGGGGGGNVDSGGGGGGGASGLGQSCGSTADCGSNLVCVPLPNNNGAGVCDIYKYPVTPSGNSCGGECETAADCCEMPVGVSLNNSQGKSIAIHQCTDILQLILGGDATVCANSPAPGSSNGIGCFYYETYCSCSASTWACTNNFCQYTNSCNLNSANELGGCPSQSRTGAGLITNCDTTANTCSIETSGCQSDSDCGPGKAVADVAGATCRGTDCTCYNQACYLKCAQDIDCQEGFACNSGTKLCEFAAACGSNSDCVTRLGDVRATCTAGVCGIPCTQDHDCSPSGAVPNLGKFNGTVCGATGVCESVGCSGNSDCLGTTTEVATFCVAPPAAGPGGTTIAHSAITSGGM